MLALGAPTGGGIDAARSYRRIIDLTFPVRASSTYRNDYHAGRSGGRVHRATDIFDRAGRGVFAARGGRIIWIPSYEHYTAGYAIQILGDDGRVYAYYHLGPAGGSTGRAYARGLALGSYVKRGQRIGVVGDSGNARGGAPHLHFEIHDETVRDPYESGRINPYFSLRAAERQGDYARGAGPASRPQRKPSADGVLRRGERGGAIRIWQRRLNKVGFRTDVDGVFGPMTHRATRRFQRSRRLTADGLVGPRTRTAMRRAERAVKNRQARPASTAGPVLRRGDRGSAVRTWQRRLNQIGFPTGVDGIFGRATEAATRRLQRARNVKVDGIVGPTTRRVAVRVKAGPSRGRSAPQRAATGPTLRRGDRGAAVKLWQAALSRARLRTAADGVFGPRTVRHTRRFQRRHDLTADGVVGARTRRAMARYGR